MARFFSILLLLAGTNLCTYAYTRYATTRAVLTEAWADTWEFLLEQEFLPPTDDSGRERSPGEDLSVNALMGNILRAGGMYYWWNDSLTYHGIGIFLIAIGVLLPFVRRGPAARTRNASGSRK